MELTSLAQFGTSEIRLIIRSSPHTSQFWQTCYRYVNENAEMQESLNIDSAFYRICMECRTCIRISCISSNYTSMTRTDLTFAHFKIYPLFWNASLVFKMHRNIKPLHVKLFYNGPFKISLIWWSWDHRYVRLRVKFRSSHMDKMNSDFLGSMVACFSSVWVLNLWLF